MPLATLPGADLHYEWSGALQGSVIVFSNSLGTDLHLWDPAAAQLGRHFRLLRYDTRGHGRSSVPAVEYTLDQLTADVLHLLDHLSIKHAAICGVSLGGLTALSLSLQAPHRFSALIAANTAAAIGSPARWSERIARVRASGLPVIADETLTRWFTPAFLGQHPDLVAPIRSAFTATNPDGYTACCAALRDADLRDQVARIAIPTLLITGSADPVTPPSDAAFLHHHIAGSTLVELPGAHLTVVETAPDFANEVITFLKKVDDAAHG